MDVFPMSWGVDTAGYEFSGDGLRIVRRGGAMRAFRPDDVQPSPHFVFADLVGGQRERLDKQPPGKRMADLPFWSRRFPDGPSALLAFVNEYGFLGYLGAGPEVREESVEHLLKQQDQLSMFYAAGMESPDRQRGESLAQGFNDYVQRTNAQGLSWRLETAKDGSISMQAVPQSLLSWMWLRAARDMVNNVDWHWCLYCGKPMALGDVFRRGAKYCSDSCNVMHNRNKPKRKGRKS